jgi:hypothetical protein
MTCAWRATNCPRCGVLGGGVCFFGAVFLYRACSSLATTVFSTADCTPFFKVSCG